MAIKVVVYRQDEGCVDASRHRRRRLPTVTRIVAGDFDGDGRDELIVGERQGKRSVYVYRAQRCQRRHLVEGASLDDGGMAGAGCAVADLNADKRPDVVCIGTATANLKWYKNTAARK